MTTTPQKPPTRNLRAFLFTALLIVGLVGWWVFNATIGEKYATAVGPDFFGKIALLAIKLVLVLLGERFIMWIRFHAVVTFFTRGDNAESEFTRLWRDEPADPRLWMALRVRLTILLVTAVVVALAF